MGYYCSIEQVHYILLFYAVIARGVRIEMLNPTQVTALSKMFSTSILSDMAKRGRSSLFCRLLRESDFFTLSPDSCISIGDAFDVAFSRLKRTGSRTEYVYRSALIQNILFGKHSLRTASALSEFRVGVCKADLIILNGSATVYEIKSDRDSLLRLKNQIDNYYKVFSKIYVIAGSSHIDDVLNKTPSSVGVMSLSRWNRITTLREAGETNEFLASEIIFDSLRINEAKEILKAMEVKYPELPNTLIRTELRKIFSQLDPKDIQVYMVELLKRTRDLYPMSYLLSNMPSALQTMALTVQLRNKEQIRLIETLKKPINEALNWK